MRANLPCIGTFTLFDVCVCVSLKKKTKKKQKKELIIPLLYSKELISIRASLRHFVSRNYRERRGEGRGGKEGGGSGTSSEFVGTSK